MREGDLGRLTEILEANGIELGATSYQIMVEHYAREDNLAMCLQLLSDMQSAGTLPNLATVEILLDLASRFNLPRLALDIAHNYEANSSRALEGRAWLRVLIASSDALFVRMLFIIFRIACLTRFAAGRCGCMLGQSYQRPFCRAR